MSTIRLGYGSEWHLLRYLGYHRSALDEAIKGVTSAQSVQWLDQRFQKGAHFHDREWRGVDFEDVAVRAAWRKFWPRKGNIPNWDAVGKVSFENQVDWLLVEAKAHLSELRNGSGAKERGGLRKIRDAFSESKAAYGVADGHDWLKPYYQFCNRLAVLHFLLKEHKPARLLFVYFVGDNQHGKRCPKCEEEWQESLRLMYNHAGLTDKTALTKRIHRIFLPVQNTASNGFL